MWTIDQVSDRAVASSQVPLKIAWFSTGRGEGSFGLLRAALDAIDAGVLPAELSVVFVNRNRGQTLGNRTTIKIRSVNFKMMQVFVKILVKKIWMI